MLQIFNYNAGKGDCLRLRYTGASGIPHNILLSHHGSVRNLSEEWCGRIRCQTYMICTDGISHPDKQTIAKLLKWNDEITIYGSTDWWTGMLTIEDKLKMEKIHFERGEYLWKLPKKE